MMMLLHYLTLPIMRVKVHAGAVCNTAGKWTSQDMVNLQKAAMLEKVTDILHTSSTEFLRLHSVNSIQ
jgi:hypothetical protein